METFRYRLDGRTYDLPKRDSQRAKVYAGERISLAVDRATKLGDGSIEAVTRFVRRVESSKTWKQLLFEANKNPYPVEIEDGRGCRIARGGGWMIKLPRWARTIPVILHELAHVARPLAAHNWPFVEAYLRLVSRFMGAEKAAALKKDFKSVGARWTPKKTFSPEVREMLRQRGLALAAMRRQNPNLVPSGDAT